MTSEWPRWRLEKVCEVKRGETITRSRTLPGSIPVVAGGLSPAYFHGISNRPAGVITVSGSGANAGTVAMWTEEIWASDCSTIISKSDKLLQRFVYHYLKAKENFIKSELRQGAAQPHVYAKDLASLEIPIPPIEEQIRILTKLDEALIDLEQLSQNLKNAIEQIDSLWNSLLRNEYVIRSDNSDLPPSSKWLHFPLGEVTIKITDGSHNPPKGIPESNFLMLSSRDIQNDKIDPVNPRYLTEVQFHSEHRRTALTVGDVLLTIVGTIGRSAIYIGTPENVTFQRSVAVLTPKVELLDPRFLMYFFQSSTDYFNNQAQGTAQKGFYLGQLKQMRVPLPPLDQQKRIVDKLDIAKIQMDELKNIYLEKLSAVVTFRSTILSAAFSGYF